MLGSPVHEGVAPEEGFAIGVGEREVGGVDAPEDAGVALADGDEVGRGLAGLPVRAATRRWRAARMVAGSSSGV